jgi:predicted transcriptional regulator
MTNKTFTENEIAVYNMIIDHSIDDDAAYVKDLAHALKMDVATVKGVVGSLTKKGMVICETEDRDGYIYNPIRAIVDRSTNEAQQSIVSFGCDWFTEEEIENMKLKSDADAHVEEVVKGDIVNMKLTAINKKNGEREEIAGTTGYDYINSKKELDMRAWFVKEVQSGAWDEHFSDFRIEVARAVVESEVAA